MLLAVVVLLPFLNSPFTIDDPIYLREAQHTLKDPLHPQAFSMVWSSDSDMRVSQILPGGVAVPYLLIPTVLASSPEWAGHLTQLLGLLIALYTTALLAFRFGLDESQAKWAVLLSAATPAVLGMTGTVMPDVPAMMFVALGMERLLAWREERRWSQALLAACWLALAVLTRTHTVLIFAAAFVLLLDGITRDQIRTSLLNWQRFLPLGISAVICLAILTITTDPEPGGENIMTSMLYLPGGKHLVVRNICAYLAHFVFVVPLAIPWTIARWRRVSWITLLVTVLAASIVALVFGWIAFIAAATTLVLLDILHGAVKRRDRLQLVLFLWLILPIPIFIYVHLPSKYLLPSVPAVVILVLRVHSELSRPVRAWLFPSVAAIGTVLSLLILLAARDLAQVQQRAVSELIKPHTDINERTWFAGHWGFQWYAEEAGAKAITFDHLGARASDIMVVSWIDMPMVAQHWPNKTPLKQVTYRSPFGLVMDHTQGVGFFSSGFGYLPWLPGPGKMNLYEVWRIN